MKELMHPDLESVLYTKEEIARRVEVLGEMITQEYRGKELLCVGILKGAVVFYADLIRAIRCELATDFMAVSSYGASTQTSGTVRIVKDLNEDIAGRDVLIVEDILDTGLTLHYLRRLLMERNPASIRICTLFDKRERRAADIQADYVGFQIPDAFIVGYGLDYAEKYRNLPYVGILSSRVYAK